MTKRTPNRGSASWVKKHPNGPAARRGGPGGGGNPGGGGGGQQGQQQSQLYEQAMREIGLGQQPQLDAINNEAQLAQQQYLGAQQGATSAYGGYQTELQALPKFDLEGLSNQLQGQLGQLAGTLGGVSPGVDQSIYGLPTGLGEGEVAAGTNLFGTQGTNAFGTLTNDASRNQMYQQSAGREGALAERYAHENLIQGMNDSLDSYAQQRLQTTAQSKDQFLARLDALRQQALENKLTKNTIKSNDAFSRYMMGLAGDAAAGTTGGGGGGDGTGTDGPPYSTGYTGPAVPGDVNGDGLVDRRDSTGPGGDLGQAPRRVVDWQNRDIGWGDLGKRGRRYIRKNDVNRTPKPPAGFMPPWADVFGG